MDRMPGVKEQESGDSHKGGKERVVSTVRYYERYYQGEQSSKTRDEINSVANDKFIKQMKTYVKLNFSSGNMGIMPALSGF